MPREPLARSIGSSSCAAVATKTAICKKRPHDLRSLTRVMAIALQQVSCAADTQRNIAQANVGRVSPQCEGCSGRRRDVLKLARCFTALRTLWSRRQESNLYLPLRRRPFYPLNYGE